jgi:hypothetical protein
VHARDGGVQRAVADGERGELAPPGTGADRHQHEVTVLGRTDGDHLAVLGRVGQSGPHRVGDQGQLGLGEEDLLLLGAVSVALRQRPSGGRAGFFGRMPSSTARCITWYSRPCQLAMVFGLAPAASRALIHRATWRSVRFWNDTESESVFGSAETMACSSSISVMTCRA